jgi:hypothetical protein
MLDLGFLVEFDIGLDENAKLSRINERFLEEKMLEMDRYCPFRKVFEMAEKSLYYLALQIPPGNRFDVVRQTPRSAAATDEETPPRPLRIGFKE